MKLQFKVQSYQTTAVESVADCLAGQPNMAGQSYRIDPGRGRRDDTRHYQAAMLEQAGFRNTDIQLDKAQLLANIQAVQRRQNLPLSDALVASAGCRLNLDVEMETGTGKTYCYIKTIFELNQRYGWSKFIIVTPSIAIREGVFKSLQITAEHFSAAYHKKARVFIYNSRQLHHIESFSSDAGVNVMIINIQAFNAAGKDNRRIYEALDDFQSRRPIDVISQNRPILILDEPQKMEGAKTLAALAQFQPLMILRYSATHRTTHNRVHRLDALDAYNQKLVKKIAVRGITVKGLAGLTAYLYLESIEISTKAPLARLELEVRQAGGIKRMVRRLEKGRDLFVVSNQLEQYRGFVIAEIDARQDTVAFTNGQVLHVGDASGDVSELMLRRIQIREAIKAHLEKEQRLFSRNIKVLSLFFIDEVARYRNYAQADEQGEYARIFEEEYERIVNEYLSELPLAHQAWQKHLAGIPVRRTHSGYFAVDKKNRLVDPQVKKRGEDAGLSDDVSAYNLILKHKERLLSFEEPVRFIFSHSALREGWDNPNVFVMCMLKHSDNTISRRQEVGRGLRLCVNQQGERMDHPATVHDLNVLTVVAGESYREFVAGLQREISASLSARPRVANEAFFSGKLISTATGPLEVTPLMAKQIYQYLLKNDYTDLASDQIAASYHQAKAAGTRAELPPELQPHAEAIWGLIDSLFSEAQLPEPTDDRRPKPNPLNANFNCREFQELWRRIHHKAIYQVDFDAAELIHHSIQALNRELTVTPLQYVIQRGEQAEQTSYDQIQAGHAFELRDSALEQHRASVHARVRYDLLGQLAAHTQLTRKTLAAVLRGAQPGVFGQFYQNPEHFISEASRLINEQKAAIIVERLTYDAISQTHDIGIFTTSQTCPNFSQAGPKLRRHIYDYVVTDSQVERDFVRELDTAEEVVVYAKLPRGFHIPTPVGDYNPDWAISFREGTVRHIYFVAETKGSMSSLELRAVEATRIECARRFFEAISQRVDGHQVRYDVVTGYGKLMELVGGGV